MIEVKHITKSYGKKQNVFTALDNVTLSIPEGSTVAITGKSGSGKSTLMHIMSGLDSPDSGQVVINGQVIHDLKKKAMDQFRAEQMSFIFQSFFVEGNQTVYQNVALPLEIADIGRRKKRQLIEEALTKVELLDKIDAKARNLSGGQKQRLAIARAIVNAPKLIFADEPTGNLDSATGDVIIDLLFDLNRKMKCTLFIVTHDEELAARCQIKIVVKDGKLVSVSDTRQAGKSNGSIQTSKTRSRKVISA
jgi:putative ABC transport system ATP-binding protein